MPSSPAVIFTPPTLAPATPPALPVLPSAAPVQPASIGPAAAAPATPPAVFVPLTPSAMVAASLTAGNILWTAASPGPEGNAITREVASITGKQISIAVAGKAVTVSAGTQYNCVVSGALTDGTNSIVFPTLVSNDFHWSNVGPLNPFSNNGYYVSGASGSWQVVYNHESNVIAEWNSDAAVTTPDQVPAGLWNGSTNPHAWKKVSTETGIPVVTLSIATSAQVISAVNASAAAAAVLSAAASGSVTGAVTISVATNLTGGSGLARPAEI